MILIFGAGGYMGSAIVNVMKDWRMSFQSGHVDTKSTNRFVGLRQQIATVNPELVINAAAFIPPASVAQCEDHKLETVRGNLLFPVELANACEASGVPLMHLSTGCLFQGDNDGKGWSEEDDPQLTWDEDPGIYISTKHAAECVVAENPSNYVIRIRLPFDNVSHPRNLLVKMAKFEVICDAANSMTHRIDGARDIVRLIKSKPGIYHVTCKGAVRNRTIFKLLAKRFGIQHKPRFVDPVEFQRMFSLTTKSNCMLSCEKVEKEIGGIRTNVLIHIENALLDWKE